MLIFLCQLVVYLEMDISDVLNACLNVILLLQDQILWRWIIFHLPNQNSLVPWLVIVFLELSMVDTTPNSHGNIDEIFLSQWVPSLCWKKPKWGKILADLTTVDKMQSTIPSATTSENLSHVWEESKLVIHYLLFIIYPF